MRGDFHFRNRRRKFAGGNESETELRFDARVLIAATVIMLVALVTTGVIPVEMFGQALAALRR